MKFDSSTTWLLLYLFWGSYCQALYQISIIMQAFPPFTFEYESFLFKLSGLSI